MTTAVEDAVPSERRHVLQDLGWTVTRAEDTMQGSARVYPEMHVPGTDHLRMSILAAWADVLAGHLAIYSVGPRVPVTLELDVHLFAPAPTSGTVSGVAKAVKVGRSVFVARVDFTAGEGEPIGFAGLSFMAAPDERLTINVPTTAGQVMPEGNRLSMPFAERAGCERVAPGVAQLGHADDA